MCSRKKYIITSHRLWYSSNKPYLMIVCKNKELIRPRFPMKIKALLKSEKNIFLKIRPQNCSYKNFNCYGINLYKLLSKRIYQIFFCLNTNIDILCSHNIVMTLNL